MMKWTIGLTALITASAMLTSPEGSTPSSAAQAGSFTAEAIHAGQAVPDNPMTLVKETERLEEAANYFFGQLSALAGFEAWRGGTWTSYPLGPGTHGWVILIKQAEQETGYMIIHAAEDKTYRLTEYGTGPYPLFSINTLHQALAQHAIIPSHSIIEKIYIDALHAVWEITPSPSSEKAASPLYFDAKTGELLPIDADTVAASASKKGLAPHTSLIPNAVIAKAWSNPAFDAYDDLSWLVKQPESIESAAQLQSNIEQKVQLVAAAAVFEDTVNLPLAVTGYHAWSSGDTFIQVQQDDLRFIPLSVLERSSSISH